MAPTPRSGGAAPPTPPIGRALRPIPREFLCRAGSPCTHQWAYPAHTRGSFRFTTKGTKGVPGLRPWTPQCVIAALFALAYASRRATFYHQPRPICHFEKSGQTGLFSPGGIAEGTPSAFRPWRGRWANWRLAGVVITICSHRYDTFTVTNDQTLSPYLYYYHYLFYIKRVSFVTVSQQMAYLCGLLVILGVIPA